MGRRWRPLTRFAGISALVLIAIFAAPALAQSQIVKCPPPQGVSSEANPDIDPQMSAQVLRKRFADERFALTVLRRKTITRRESEILEAWRVHDEEIRTDYERERDALSQAKRAAAENGNAEEVARITEEMRQLLRDVSAQLDTLLREMREEQKREAERIRAEFDARLAALAKTYETEYARLNGGLDGGLTGAGMPCAAVASAATQSSTAAQIQPQPTVAEGLVGSVTTVDGEAYVIQADGSKDRLTSGTALHLGDIVQTEDRVDLSIMFVDDTSIQTGTDSHLVIDEYFFDPDVDGSQSNFTLWRGLAVFISGKLGRNVSHYCDFNDCTGVSVGIRG